MKIEFHNALRPLATRYDAFILDLWGVVHDGARLYPGVKECLGHLKKHGKKIILLSNAPRRSAKIVAVLDHMEVPRGYYDHVVSSGDTAYRFLSKMPQAKYYYLGPDKDTDLADGLPHERVATPEEAQFIINTGFPVDGQPISDLEPLLRKAQSLKLPLLCINPDYDIVTQTGDHLLCAGAIGEHYESMGGDVAWFGKPYPEAYEECFSHLGGISRERILAIGDNLLTDIAGAEQAKIASAIVVAGVTQYELHIEDYSTAAHAKVEAFCAEHDIMPRYGLPALVWK